MAARGQLHNILLAQKYGDVQVIFFKGFVEIPNGRHWSTAIFLWVQKLKT